MVFIESRYFTKRLEELAGAAADEVLRTLQKDLLNAPERGQLVRGLGGIRKARAGHAARQKGRRGGLRYLYLYLLRKDHVHLLYVYGKHEQDDLTPAERATLRRIVEEIKRD